ncbi:MAG: polysaccharide deacetylase family protein [candidate division WOR-3 bacterium]
MSLSKPFLVISLDFELAWGVNANPVRVERYKNYFTGARKAIPHILRTFADYQIHATWAVVGCLFARNRDELMALLPREKPAYINPNISPYNFIQLVGRNEEEAPLYYAPSLIKEIMNYPNQEIASHTFSHYFCWEPGQDALAFQDDLISAQKAAAHYGIQLNSIVFPRNQIRADYLRISRKMGFIAYRGLPKYGFDKTIKSKPRMLLMRGLRFADFYFPLTGNNICLPQNENNATPVNIPASRFLRPWSPALKIFESIRLKRIVSEMTYAARNGLGYHLWWHPENFGLNINENLAVLKRVLDHFSKLRESFGMESLGITEVVNRMQ